MADEKQPKLTEHSVTSAFVWNKAIQKPGDKVMLTAQQAYGLIKRGKIADPAARKPKPAAKAAG